MNTQRHARNAFRTLALALALTGVSAPALAQNEPPPVEEGSGDGRPLDGYLATGCLCGLALFIVAKSARR